jgi:hypothetical protein
MDKIKNTVKWKHLASIAQYLAHIAYEERRLWRSPLGLKFTRCGHERFHYRKSFLINISDVIWVKSATVFVFRSSISWGRRACTVFFTKSHQRNRTAVSPLDLEVKQWAHRDYISYRVSFRKSRASIDQCGCAPSCWERPCSHFIVVVVARGTVAAYRVTVPKAPFRPRHSVPDVNFGISPFKFVGDMEVFSVPCDDVMSTTGHISFVDVLSPSSSISDDSHVAHAQWLSFIKLQSFMTTHVTDEHCTNSCLIFTFSGSIMNIFFKFKYNTLYIVIIVSN